jgi:hypothetical protein
MQDRLNIAHDKKLYETSLQSLMTGAIVAASGLGTESACFLFIPPASE